jgi:hypothetical protein
VRRSESVGGRLLRRTFTPQARPHLRLPRAASDIASVTVILGAAGSLGIGAAWLIASGTASALVDALTG